MRSVPPAVAGGLIDETVLLSKHQPPATAGGTDKDD